MTDEVSSSLVEQLLKVPPFFKRENSRSFLFTPYSRKIHRRIYCYGQDDYDLWVLLESDLSVASFNERVPTVQIIIRDKIQQLTPAFAAEMRDKSVVVHFVLSDQLMSDDKSNSFMSVSPDHETALQSWANQHGFAVIIWTHALLQTNQTRLENIKRLLRYVCTPQSFPSISIKELLLVTLRQSRTTTIDHVLNMLRTFDEDLLMTVLADMILTDVCFSDIDLYPLHYSTELSIHHDFLKSNK